MLAAHYGPSRPVQVDLFVIGTASLDVLHFGGQTLEAAGGAGLYTALAAQRAGVRTGLIAPRPEPMPAALQPAVERLEWLGPVITVDDLPRLEIEHHGGGQATLLAASWGAEARLTVDAIPPEVTEATFIHIAALSTAQRQLDVLQAVRQLMGTHGPRLSVGTYARLAYGETGRVRRLFELADLFFMNENEARGLFGRVEQAQTRPEALLFITLGEAGALVIEGDRVTHISGQPAIELDPTGAGDTFCGATLAGLARGLSPLAAATAAAVLAAQVVSQVGPAALLEE
jgi:sugar/nucleoside kinase (ribokinase family)